MVWFVFIGNRLFWEGIVVMAHHHPSKALFPNWTLWIRNQLFHKVITIIQHMNETEQNLADIRAFADAIEFEYLMKRRVLDETEE